MQVNQVMTPGVECIRPGDSIRAAAEHLREVGMALPVCGDNNRLVGVVDFEDLGRQVRPVAPPTRISQVMRPSIYCFEDQDTAEAARLMRANGVRRLAVLDREMRLVGTIWFSDVAEDYLLHSYDDHDGAHTDARWSASQRPNP